MYALTFGLATVIWSKPQPSPVNEIAISSVLRALWLVAFGMTFWAVGYLVGPTNLARRIAQRGVAAITKRRSGTVRSLSTPWLLYLIGTLARFATTATTGRFGYVGDPASALTSANGYEQLLSELSLFCPSAICAAALQVYRQRLRKARITLVILSVTEIVLGAAAGGKESFVLVILAIAIPMSASQYRLPKTVVISGVAIFLFVIIPFNHAYRNAVRGGARPLSTSQAIHDAPQIFRLAVTSQNVPATATESVIYLLQRMDEISGPAIVLQRTPAQIHYSSPMELIEAPLLDSVPRAIWPGKPKLAPRV